MLIASNPRDRQRYAHMTMKVSRGIAPALLFALGFSAFQLYNLTLVFLSSYEVFIAYIMLYVSLAGLLVLFVKFVEGSQLDQYGFHIYARKLVPTLLGASFFAIIYYVVNLEAGAITGFGLLPKPSLFLVGFFLLSAPLVVTAEEGIYRGYILTRLTGTISFTGALFLSSVLYALQLTSFPTLVTLGLGAAVQYLFANTVAALTLGIVMGLYFYKSTWSLLGPLVFRTGLILETNLFPFSAKISSWEFAFVFQMIGYSVIILMVATLIQEPKFLARLYLGMQAGPKRGRLLTRTLQRRALRRTVGGVIFLGVVAISLTFGAQGFFHSPFRAVASGSMQPTLRVGDLSVVLPVSSQQDIRVGDIIAYKVPYLSGPVIHRVVDVLHAANGNVEFVTKGDNNTSPDPIPVAYGYVEGKVVYDIPALGYLILLWPLTLAVFLVLAIIPSLNSIDVGRKRTGMLRH